ncbi:hypothetical protein [Pseudactinotalea sp. Z1748]|uniref:hypothetical protein n=1 Tax=Pseudactinotalea sp. Z1748 TaxID=3413027 RepID=UPI003C7BC3E2
MSLLHEKLAPLWSAINRLQARQMSIFPATVTSVDPVRIRIDGEAQSLAASPDVGVTVGPGDRVRVLRYGTSHLIVARMNIRRQPFAVAAGAVTIPPSSSATSSASVNFPAGRFTQNPFVVATSQNSNYAAYVSSRGTTSASIGSRRLTGTDVGEHLVWWTATQMEP